MPFFSFASTIAGWTLRKPATRKYPFETRTAFEATRGHIAIDINACTFCTLCAKRCPTEAIEVDRTGKEWKINRLRCIQCSYCIDACPKKCLKNENAYSPAVVKTGEYDSFKGTVAAVPAGTADNPTA